MDDDKKEYLSAEKHKQLSEELERLKTVERKEIAKSLEYAKSLGDLSENAEYHEARERQSEVEDRIKQLEEILKNAEIISAHKTKVVSPGSNIKIKKISNGQEMEFTLVGSEEVDISASKISYQSPLGSALVGHKAGDEVKVNTPKGEVNYKIISLE